MDVSDLKELNLIFIFCTQGTCGHQLGLKLKIVFHSYSVSSWLILNFVLFIYKNHVLGPSYLYTKTSKVMTKFSTLQIEHRQIKLSSNFIASFSEKNRLAYSQSRNDYNKLILKAHFL